MVDPRDAARLLDKALTASGARRLMSGADGPGGPFARPARRAIRAGALSLLARRLAASAVPAHRELAALLAAALAEADDATALALVSTAARKPDLRAEKIVSHRYRFLWICNPKAASRSLIAALCAADPEAVLIRRRTLAQVLARYPEAADFFSFAFVRHPFGRIRSFHADKHGLALHDPRAYRWFIEPWHGLARGMRFGELCRWLATPAGSDAFADRHWLSQHAQIRTPDGRLPDFVGRWETLDDDWRTVTAHAGMPRRELPRLNARAGAAPGAGDAEALAAAALLRRRYAEDFRLWGYGP